MPVDPVPCALCTVPSTWCALPWWRAPNWNSSLSCRVQCLVLRYSQENTIIIKNNRIGSDRLFSPIRNTDMRNFKGVTRPVAHQSH